MEQEYAHKELLRMSDLYLAHNYELFNVFPHEAMRCWVWDIEHKRYIDMLSCYSALNLGHIHSKIERAHYNQSHRISTLAACFPTVEKVFFAKELAEFCKMEMVLFMVTGAEAVETAIKVARKYAYTKRCPIIPANQAEIIVCDNNFHGRTITVISFSTEKQYRDYFGPHTGGFKCIPFGDANALREAITPNTAAFLVEPIQGEGGINVPPEGYLTECYDICKENNVLFVADEIQTGLARTGRMFACDYECVKPDILILGKALGGGIEKISAVVSSREILGVIKEGDHGSTFGGNPLACRVARESLRVLVDENMPWRVNTMGQYFAGELKKIKSPYVAGIRGKGLLLGIELKEGSPHAHKFCEKLIEEGVLCKEARRDVIRLSPPLIIEKWEIDWALKQIAKVLTQSF